MHMRALCVGVHAGRPRPLPDAAARGWLPALLPQVGHDGSHHLCQPGILDPGMPTLAPAAARLFPYRREARGKAGKSPPGSPSAASRSSLPLRQAAGGGPEAAGPAALVPAPGFGGSSAPGAAERGGRGRPGAGGADPAAPPGPGPAGSR